MYTLKSPQIGIKNTRKRTIRTLYDKDALLLIITSDVEENFTYKSQLNKKNIHFYFCLDGKATFNFDQRYTRNLETKKNYLLYNPDIDITLTITLASHSRMIVLILSLEQLHNLFSEGRPHFLQQENINYKFYDERDISSQLRVTLSQLFATSPNKTMEGIYYQGKVLEIISLYFSNKKESEENCPFLNDQEVVRKIKKAKEYLLEKSEQAPSLKDVSKIVGLNEYQLKVGFKRIYGDTAHGFLTKYRLDRAHSLLESNTYQVNEVAYLIGYTNTSHFIAAFKKKFGITPKKYLMSLH